MAKKKKKRRTKKSERQQYYALTSFIMLLIVFISVFQLGTLGEYIDSIFTYLFGISRYFTYIIIVLTSIYVAMNHNFPFTKRMFGYVLLQFGLIFLFHSVLYIKNRTLISNYYTFDEVRSLISQTGAKNFTGGGVIGQVLFTAMNNTLSFIGTVILAAVFIYFSVIMIRNKSVETELRKDFSRVAALLTLSGEKISTKTSELIEKNKENRKERPKKEKKEKKAPVIETDDSIETPIEKPSVEEELVQETYEPEIVGSDDFEDDSIVESKETRRDIEYDEEELEETIDEESVEDNTPLDELDDEEIKELLEYKTPPITLLKDAEVTEKMSNDVVLKQGKVLEETLHNFGVKAKVSKIRIGPAVTQFEVQPDIGVKVSRIINLQNDIALSLAAKDIRIEAPIPGKSAVGIEVPNSVVSMVTLREVIKRKTSTNPLEVALGKDISGAPIMAELNKMPHLLVAGSTGSGKSVCINGIIVSILLNAKPHEVKLMMIDPKMVELNTYNGIPHLLSPVVTNPQKAADALQRVVNEMERRYDLFSATNTKNISAYNKYLERTAEDPDKVSKMPYIVVIIDELADLMMVASKDVEASITRIAQMARAAGIHLIIATQRPSVDVITGIIKANIPSRIAFAVSSTTDSRTILDSGGAEKLLGKGDMLFLPSGRSKPIRVQGAFLSDEEVHGVVDFVTSQMKANYDKSVILNQKEPKKEEVESEDELYPDAKMFVITEQRASASLLQRQFRIGYNRAARLVDDLERNGIIGPAAGSKPRNVLVTESDLDMKES
ncbi:MAG TPA: DNA translocase FtsK [Candidatus Nosocomiicoccus stercorigallinarum]|nr:DNA translocase FtsK [Candidatus Nosocomiicoccus stercorigallinarum]